MGDEVEPAVGGVEREHRPGALPVGQVEVLRMRLEPVGAIAASWHREWRSGTDDDGLTACEAPGLRSCAPSAFQLPFHGVSANAASGVATRKLKLSSR